MSYLKRVEENLERLLEIENKDTREFLQDQYQYPDVELDGEIEKEKIESHKDEEILMERGKNSFRLSILFKKLDLIDVVVVSNISELLPKRADEYGILRKKPVEGYDLSFLITAKIFGQVGKKNLINHILYVLDHLTKTVNQMKLTGNAMTRALSTEYLKTYV